MESRDRSNEITVPDALLKQGTRLFGSEQNFKYWLYQKNIALGDIKPIDLLQKPGGLKLVETAIGALEHGNFL